MIFLKVLVLKTAGNTPGNIWDKVFKNEPSKICGREPLKILKGYSLLKQTIFLQIFKGCHPQFLLGPLLNTLSHWLLNLFLTMF